MKQEATDTWSRSGFIQQTQVGMESYYFSVKTEPRLCKLRDENAPPLSMDLTDMDGPSQVEKEWGKRVVTGTKMHEVGPSTNGMKK